MSVNSDGKKFNACIIGSHSNFLVTNGGNELITSSQLLFCIIISWLKI